MDWLKKNYEKVILLGTALVAIAIAMVIILGSQDFLAAFHQRNSTTAPNHTVESAPTEQIAASISSLQNPVSWIPGDGSLFVSRTYILKDNTLVDPLESEIPLHPPIPNKWIMENNLDPSDVNLLNSDPDADGFTTLEEWESGSNPSDPASIPPYYIKLRLKEFVEVPFRLKFTTPDDGETFSINTIDQKGRTQFLKMGDVIHGTPYKLISYKPEHITTEMGLDKDVSKLELENTENGEKVVLINDTVVNSPSSYATFSYLQDVSEFKVKKGDTFTLSPDKETKYKLIDISKSDAVIQDVQSGTKIKILPTGISLPKPEDSVTNTQS